MRTSLLTIFNTALLVYLVCRQLRIPSAPTQPTLEGEFMFIVKADNPPVNYSSNFTATDSEGNTVDAADLTTEVVSSDEAVVSVSQTDNNTGVVSFGSPGLASLNATVKKSDGTLLGSFGAQFTIVTGDVTAISGGSLVFEGLTEAPSAEEPAVTI